MRIPKVEHKTFQDILDSLINSDNKYIESILDSIQKVVPPFVCGTIDPGSFLKMKFSEEEKV